MWYSKFILFLKFSKSQDRKAKVHKDVKEAVEELNQVLSGKIEARNADELLNEL